MSVVPFMNKWTVDEETVGYLELLVQFQILILDEPSSGLDPEARRVVWDLLQQVSQ